MVSRAMELCRAQECDVVVLAKVLHELGYELLGWKATEPAILRGNNDVESTVRVSNLPAILHTSENCTGGYRGDSEGLPGVSCRK
jgi:hypothetical protein